nr:hypothetical protein GCM10020093_064790 [Planobispora longispora]
MVEPVVAGGRRVGEQQADPETVRGGPGGGAPEAVAAGPSSRPVSPVEPHARAPKARTATVRTDTADSAMRRTGFMAAS